MELSETCYEIDDGVATVTLNRPDRMNAFTPNMARELVSLFETASLDDRVRVVIVTGAGRAFCAGAELGTGAATFIPGGGNSFSGSVECSA